MLLCVNRMNPSGQNTSNQLAEILFSNRGKQKICFDGFINEKCRNGNDKYYWVCEKNGKKGNSEYKGTANTLYIYKSTTHHLLPQSFKT